jgi:hypothetical protein
MVNNTDKNIFGHKAFFSGFRILFLGWNPEESESFVSYLIYIMKAREERSQWVDITPRIYESVGLTKPVSALG